VEDSDEEEQTRPKLRVNRELINLGVIPSTSIPRRKQKAKVVSRGFMQIPGVEYT
jgi:hypothetical protein